MYPNKIAYLSFDTVPAPKGAAIHIDAFAQSLAAAYSEIQLITVSPTEQSNLMQKSASGVIQTTLPAIGKTLIDRVLYFRAMLVHWLQGKYFDTIQFRSIYEGFPIALNKKQYCDRLIFEVNGLPSIELKYRYPAVAEDRELLQKLIAQEQICLNAADLVITPSLITGNYLQTRGVAAEKIRVIPNGVDLDIFTPRLFRKRTEEQLFHLLYFGTLSAWQGVAIALEATALFCHDFPAQLTIIGPSRPAQINTLEKLAKKLEIFDKIKLLPPLPQSELIQQLHQADAIAAPLTPNDRNLLQGCCPLKVLEGMASGTPVIASDLPVVRELGIDGVHFLLVRPNCAKSLKDAMLQLYQNPQLAAEIAIAARQQIEMNYTWQKAGDALVAAYQELGIDPNFKTHDLQKIT